VRGAAPYTVPLLLALALAGPGCRVRDQAEGPYDFTPTSVEKDECLRVPAAGPVLSGDLATTGNWMNMATDWYGMTLTGRYLDAGLFDSSADRFFADGSAQHVTADVGGLHCDLDQATVHLDATTDTATQFHGTLRFRYEARQPPGCLCETWVSFQALHQ